MTYTYISLNIHTYDWLNTHYIYKQGHVSDSKNHLCA